MIPINCHQKSPEKRRKALNNFWFRYFQFLSLFLYVSYIIKIFPFFGVWLLVASHLSEESSCWKQLDGPQTQLASSVLVGHSLSSPCSQYNSLIHQFVYGEDDAYVLPYDRLCPFVRKGLLGVLLTWGRISGWVKSTKTLRILRSIMWLLRTGWTDVLRTLTRFYASIDCIMFRHCALSILFSFSQGLFPKREDCSSLACYYMLD